MTADVQFPTSGASAAAEFTVLGGRFQISFCSDSVKVMSRLVVTSKTANRDITRPGAPLPRKATTLARLPLAIT